MNTAINSMVVRLVHWYWPLSLLWGEGSYSFCRKAAARLSCTCGYDASSREKDQVAGSPFYTI